MVVSLAQKAVVGQPAPAYRPGEDGYADWVILAVQGLKEYLGHPYRKLMDVLRWYPDPISDAVPSSTYSSNTLNTLYERVSHMI